MKPPPVRRDQIDRPCRGVGRPFHAFLPSQIADRQAELPQDPLQQAGLKLVFLQGGVVTQPLTPTLSPQSGRGSIAWLASANTDPEPDLNLPAGYFTFPKIAASACYQCGMLVLIFGPCRRVGCK
jgi:hypothetical protein